MQILIYEKQYKSIWNDFVAKSKNGTFIFYRDYMEYHAARFQDFSLLIFNEKNQLVALLAAHRVDKILISHQGLTYGGLIVDVTMTQSKMIQVFNALINFLLTHHITQLVYKTIPSIYHRHLATEDQYVLFLLKAQLKRRDVLTVIAKEASWDIHERRLRRVKKAQQYHLTVKYTRDYAEYWNVLSNNLSEKFGVSPVHTLEEIHFLERNFPANIKLFGCYQDERMLAGIVVYESECVAHMQYIATTERGRKIGALDFLISQLIQHIYPNKAYIDFGSSNEEDGRQINQGLVDFKAGFGGRSVMHDFYQVDLTEETIGLLKAAII